MTQQLTEYFKYLHVKSGKPTIRELAKSTGYGKTTISDALTGRALPTWNVTKALVVALGGEGTRARAHWGAAQGARTADAAHELEWLISVHDPEPPINGTRRLIEVSAMARDDPNGAIGAGWEAIRVCAIRLSARYYEDIPGSWSSNVVDTLQRAHDDDRLPAWVPKQARLLHTIYVKSRMPEALESGPSPAAAIQYACLAYRLAWQVQAVAFPANEVISADGPH